MKNIGFDKQARSQFCYFSLQQRGFSENRKGSLLVNCKDSEADKPEVVKRKWTRLCPLLIWEAVIHCTRLASKPNTKFA